MKLLGLIAVLGAGCGPFVFGSPPPSTAACVTAHGVEVFGKIRDVETYNDHFDYCAEFQEVEDRALKAFRDVVKTDARFTKVDFTGWKVRINDVADWRDESGLLVIGQTYCGASTIDLSFARPAKTAYAHELAHAIQHCEPLQPWNFADFYHSNWGAIRKALADANLTP